MEAQSAFLNPWASFQISGRYAYRKVCLKPEWLKSSYLLCISCTELPSTEKYKEHRLYLFLNCLISLALFKKIL